MAVYEGNHQSLMDSAQQRPVKCFVILSYLLKKQSGCWWFETPWRSWDVSAMLLFSLSGSLFTMPWDVLSWYLSKSRGRAVECKTGIPVWYRSTDICQIPDRLGNSKREIRGFHTSRYITILCPSALRIKTGSHCVLCNIPPWPRNHSIQSCPRCCSRI